jgi:hypothetical protein
MNPKILHDYYKYIQENKVDVRYLEEDKNYTIFNDGSDTGIELNEAYAEKLEACVNALQKRYHNISDKKISDILLAYVKDYQSAGDTRKQICKIIESKIQEFIVILPNRSVVLKDCKSYKAEDVECFRSDSLEERFKLNKSIIIDNYKMERSKVDDSFYLPEFCFIVKVKCSSDLAEEFAMKKVRIFLGLLRLHYILYSPEVTFFPENGEPEMDAYNPYCYTNKFLLMRESEPSEIAYFSSQNALFGKYYIDNNIRYYLQKNGFEDIFVKSLNVKDKTVLKNLTVALEWLIKSRTSVDLPNRFLFQIMALEALYSIREDMDKAESFAKFSSKLLSQYEEYMNIYNEVKRLYDIRSAIVHEGFSRKLTKSKCDRVERIIEETCLVILKKYIGYSTKDFLKDINTLSDHSAGG